MTMYRYVDSLEWKRGQMLGAATRLPNRILSENPPHMIGIAEIEVEGRPVFGEPLLFGDAPSRSALEHKSKLLRRWRGLPFRRRSSLRRLVEKQQRRLCANRRRLKHYGLFGALLGGVIPVHLGLLTSRFRFW